MRISTMSSAKNEQTLRTEDVNDHIDVRRRRRSLEVQIGPAAPAPDEPPHPA